MTAKRNVHGEGNYEASRRYDEATKKFVESGQVEAAARAAAPESPEVAAEMKLAEQAALLRAKVATRRDSKAGASERPGPVEEPPATPDSPVSDPDQTPPKPGGGPDRH